MNRHLPKNYLRSRRKKVGLTQRDLGLILGQTTGSKVSLLEAGRSVPTIQDAIAFRRLFRQSVEELWPDFTRDLESTVDSSIRRLIDRLQKTQTGSSRKRLRADLVLRELETIIEELPRK
jgi:transcriptional regulator with XRE-family HTH domain